MPSQSMGRGGGGGGSMGGRGMQMFYWANYKGDNQTINGYISKVGYAGFDQGGPPRGMPLSMGMPGPGGFMPEQVTTTQVITKNNLLLKLCNFQVTIPNELAGTIIGKGGDRINRFILKIIIHLNGSLFLAFEMSPVLASK
jgi:hypothetical protein